MLLQISIFLGFVFLRQQRLGEVGERLLALDDQMSLCNKVLEDLRQLQGIVLVGPPHLHTDESH